MSKQTETKELDAKKLAEDLESERKEIANIKRAKTKLQTKYNDLEKKYAELEAQLLEPAQDEAETNELKVPNPLFFQPNTPHARESGINVLDIRRFEKTDVYALPKDNLYLKFWGKGGDLIDQVLYDSDEQRAADLNRLALLQVNAAKEFNVAQVFDESIQKAFDKSNESANELTVAFRLEATRILDLAKTEIEGFVAKVSAELSEVNASYKKDVQASTNDLNASIEDAKKKVAEVAEGLTEVQPAKRSRRS